MKRPIISCSSPAVSWLLVGLLLVSMGWSCQQKAPTDGATPADDGPALFT
ncbi:MAG: hypothetical protein H7Z72_07755, partial [Bacteroidetes bacterium]|nr:hypothetical protein [Fibrella sp.]